MARIKRAMIRRTRKKKLFNRVKGFFVARKNLRQANQARMKAESYSYVGRKLRKRDFRRLWNQRINAAVRQHGLNYSRFIFGLKKANVTINRKMLADLAVREPAAFEVLAKQAQAAL
ncbi:MAG: 50S ribosomal protein L20 [Proteobacteria bacterium]|jgi:large subunit ribosomal protein L20|nr:50S ribosomal protein L20 [Pseudomonadota bacterium]